MENELVFLVSSQSCNIFESESSARCLLFDLRVAGNSKFRRIFFCSSGLMMRTVALISGGKDSCYNMLQCIAAGHEIVALANLYPPKYDNVECKTLQIDEMDSYMYQTVGHDAINLYSEATGLPLYREAIQGTSIQQGSGYIFDSLEDEVEDLYRLLARVKEAEAVEAVSVGAILSNYQRVRVENV